MGRDTIEFRRPFEFDGDVAECFDDMLARSIPDYRTMRALTDRLGARYAGRGDAVLGIGTSLGRDIDSFALRGCEVVSCESSAPMYERQRKSFESFSNVDVRLCDVTREYPAREFRLALAVLTLQFIRPEDRDLVVARTYEHLADGGAFIVVEKVLGETWELDAALSDEYYREKGANGYTSEQLESKREALAFVMQPYKASQNEAMLRSAGFRKVDCFWRHLNFAGWVAVK